jgi:hypothetical protein
MATALGRPIGADAPTAVAVIPVVYKRVGMPKPPKKPSAVQFLESLGRAGLAPILAEEDLNPRLRYWPTNMPPSDAPPVTAELAEATAAEFVRLQDAHEGERDEFETLLARIRKLENACLEFEFPSDAELRFTGPDFTQWERVKETRATLLYHLRVLAEQQESLIVAHAGEPPEERPGRPSTQLGPRLQLAGWLHQHGIPRSRIFRLLGWNPDRALPETCAPEWARRLDALAFRISTSAQI